MAKHLIYKSNVRWGRIISSLAFYVFFLGIFYFYWIFNMVFLNKMFLLFLLFFLPIFILNILFFPVLKSFLFRLLKKDDFNILLYKEAIQINDIFLNWSKIKSLSFDTGRIKSDSPFFEGIKLIAFQRLYILDKKGKEYSCIIDVDYFLKGNRRMNNLNLLREYLVDEKKSFLISDWAEKN